MGTGIYIGTKYNKKTEHIENFLKTMQNHNYMLKILDYYGQKGVEALAEATPIDTGESADSWEYEVINDPRQCQIIWTNSHVTTSGVPIVILLQYGHGTGTGGYVEGRDFINPAISGIFDDIADAVWEAVTSS